MGRVRCSSRRGRASASCERVVDTVKVAMSVSASSSAKRKRRDNVLLDDQAWSRADRDGVAYELSKLENVLPVL